MSEINEKDMQLVGDNIRASVTSDNKLVIMVDLSKEIGPSSSGKMMGIGSSGGFAMLPGGVKGNIYIGKKI